MRMKPVDYTVEWINGEFVRVPKRRAVRNVTAQIMAAGPVQRLGWNVKVRPIRGRTAPLPRHI